MFTLLISAYDFFNYLIYLIVLYSNRFLLNSKIPARVWQCKNWTIASEFRSQFPVRICNNHSFQEGPQEGSGTSLNSPKPQSPGTEQCWKILSPQRKLWIRTMLFQCDLHNNEHDGILKDEMTGLIVKQDLFSILNVPPWGLLRHMCGEVLWDDPWKIQWKYFQAIKCDEEHVLGQIVRRWRSLDVKIVMSRRQTDPFTLVKNMKQKWMCFLRGVKNHLWLLRACLYHENFSFLGFWRWHNSQIEKKIRTYGNKHEVQMSWKKRFPVFYKNLRSILVWAFKYAQGVENSNGKKNVLPDNRT